MAFRQIPSEPNFPELEEGILSFWERSQIFAKTLKKTKKGEPFVFFEGPPTANGKPHIGHVATRIFKDIAPRYQTMRGKYVLRKGGWDTHGLPVEIEVEKQLGISGKQDIENLVPGDPVKSVAKFNRLCQKSVWKYVDEWTKMIRRVGHWIDLDAAYITYAAAYIESVWWAFKEYFDQGLLYRGYKVVPYCTRCGTPLSSHEVAQGYEEVTDPAVYIKFAVAGEKSTFFLAWTTTPWTLPGNVALAVDEKATYVKAKAGEEFVYVAQALAAKLGLTEIAATLPGSELVGKRYQPLYPWLRALIDKKSPQFVIVPADFVSLEEGTGLVHTAVMYGEEDFALGLKIGLPQRHLVDKNGRFMDGTGWLAGKYVKDADAQIIHDLRTRNLIFKEERVRHQYPFCWRCHKPLLYYALESWFIKTTAVKEDLIKNNRAVNWVPEYVGKGRMGNWYDTLIDWSISRNRYWGTPLPAWVCDKNHEHIEVIGSFKELAARAHKRLGKNFDPHRPYIDEYSWACSHKDGGLMRRVPEVTDVWHDSGCMPFAQWHYPFENKDMIDNGRQFPADYISEAIDQTRGWFYSLMAASTMLFKKTPYRNAVVFAHALDEKGRKMSKHLGNVIDPWQAINTVGADPLRWFFLTSVTVGTPYRVSLDVLRENLRRFFLPLWHSTAFFVTYANVDKWSPGKKDEGISNILDEWITARLNVLIEEVTERLDAFDYPAAGRAIQDFVVNDLSAWYIRRSRDRLGPAGKEAQDKESFYTSAYAVLKTLSTLLAPFTPLTADYLYRLLREAKDPLSVHLEEWPTKGRVDRQLLTQMRQVREVVELGLRQRKDKGIRVRQPLSQVKVAGIKAWSDGLAQLIADELNVKEVRMLGGRTFKVELDAKLTPVLKEEGTVREIVRAIQDLRKQAGYKFDDKITVAVAVGDKRSRALLIKHQQGIEQATLATFGQVKKADATAEISPYKISVAK